MLRDDHDRITLDIDQFMANADKAEANMNQLQDADTDATPVDVHTWIMRAIGTSREDAERVVNRIAAETISGMPQTPTHDLAAVLADDQVHAAVQRVSASVAQHYATLRQTGMPDKRAAQLCAAMQEQWLAGVLPVPAEVMAYMREDGEGLE